MYTNGFYNPYINYGFMNNMTNIGRYNTLGKTSLFSLFKKFNLNNFLTGANKTLNVVNQAIPIYNQVKPMITNAKTMFKVMRAVKSNDNTPIKTNNLNKKESINQPDGSPTFFI